MDRREVLRAAAKAAALVCLNGTAIAGRSVDRFRLTGWQDSRRFVVNQFGKIAYVDSGSGDAVVFLHGYPLNGFQWRGSVEQLDLFYRCIVPDFMGLGVTEVAAGQDLGPHSQAAMILSLIDALGLTRVHLVANDSGGAVAQIIVAHHPERIRSLLLTNSDTERQSPPPAMKPVIELAKQGLYVHQWLEPWFENRSKAREPDQFGGMCYADPSNPTDEAIEMYFGPVLETPERRRMVEAHAIAQETNALAGISPLLARCPVPTRIVWGMADTIFDIENAGFLDRAFGNSRGVRKLAESKLFWPEERPEVIAEEAHLLWRSVKV